MRIADITEFYSPRGGVRTHLTQKARVLRGRGHHHVVIAAGLRDEEGPLDPPDAEQGSRDGETGSASVVQIAGPTLPYDPNYHLLWRIDKVHRAVARLRPDVLSVNSLYLAALAAQTLPRRAQPLLTIAWHADFVDTYAREFLRRYVSDTASDRMVEPVWRLVRDVANRFAATFVASRSQREKLERRGFRRVIEIPFGVDRARFRPEARSEAVRERLLGPQTQARLLVGVGRLSSEKGWDIVLRGFSRLYGTRDVRLVVFGDGPERERLSKLAPAESVVFMGFEPDRSKVAEAIASADLFVHGCPHETFGLSVAEAIACGVPIVVPHAGGAGDLARPGFSERFAPTDDAEFAAAADRVLAELDRYRRAAEAAALETPSVEDQVMRTVEAYGQLLSEHGRPAT